MALTTVNSGLLDSNAQYTGFKNRIINGAMVIDQRNAGASVTLNDGIYVVDRFGSACSQSSKATAQRSTTAPAGFTNSYLITSSSAYSVTSTDFFTPFQNIEGFNTADLAWGTANAATVTLSFWVRSSLTGTFGGAITNDALNRSYPFTYTINAANTFEYKTIAIAGDTTGTWVGASNSIGMRIYFGLGVGSTYSGTAGAWAGTRYQSATGATSVVGTSGATFYITGVQLEKGSTATSFDYRPYSTELALCQRYFQVVDHLSMLAARTSTNLETSFMFPSWMRTAPSLDTGSSQTYSVYDSFGNNFQQSSLSVVYAVSGATSKGAFISLANFTGLTQGRTYVTDAGNRGKIGLTAEL